jgi:PAB-dependent poly(A)-specific ribonuclease subunit 3
MTGIELWKKILHPNLVHLREVFTTKAFGDHSMVFVYDYHPGSETLMSRHFGSTSVSKTDVVGYGQMPSASPKFRNHGNDQMLTPSGTVQLPEALIWTYIVQLSSVLRTIHGHGLACRVMDPTKILLVDKTRIRLNCVGVFDIVNFDANLQSGSAQMERYKQEDLTSLGRVVLALANNSVQCLQTPAAAVAFVSRNYSSDLKNLILYLMTPQPHARNINDVMPMIGARFYSQLEATHLRNDILEQALSQEVENGRLFKLLCKLGTINERPEYSMDVSWSETGDRYMLKLFRDYLFHQVDASGAPWLDMAHIIQSLNKLNAGVPEKICLSSRDDDIIVLVSYAELKRCIESSFNELTSAAAAAATRDGRAASTVGSYS